MRAVLMSIKPKWCTLIFSGGKTIEVRKTAPKLETPFKVYVYETKNKGGNKIVNEALNAVYGGGKVVGEFVCDDVDIFVVGSFHCDSVEALSCLSHEEMIDYFYKPEELDGRTIKLGKGLHITEPKLYDKPKELGEFVSCKYYNGNECALDRGCVCPYQKPDWNPDGSINIFCCEKRLTRPPQSWCYVEEAEE